MKFYNRLSLGTKIIAISTGLAGIFLLTTVGFLTFKTYKNLKESSIEALATSNHLEGEKIEIQLNSILIDLKSLSQSPFVSQTLGSSPITGKTGLKAVYIAEMNSNPIYDQLRLLNERGEEVVRVNNINGNAEAVEESQLQDKSNRPYFIQSKELKPGEVYISNVELNREGSPPKIEVPYKPTLRYAFPIFDDLGNFKGTIVANVLFSEVATPYHPGHEIATQNYIVDEKGFYLFNQDSQKEFGGPIDLNSGINIRNDHQDIEEAFKEDSQIFFLEESILSSEVIKYHPNRDDKYWINMELIEKDKIFGPLFKNIKRFAFLSIILFILLFFTFTFSIQKMLTPLKELSKNAEAIGRGEFNQKIDIKREDEIGRLATSLKGMSKKLKTLYKSLEKKVKEKTKALSKKVNELEKTKHAMINVANDLNIEREQVSHERDKLNTILENIGDAVFVIDKASNIIVFNKAASIISGVKQDKAIEKSYKKVLKFLDEKTNKPDPFIENVFKSKDTQEMGSNTVLVKKNGKRIPVADSAAPLKNKAGEVIGVIVVFRDVAKERAIDKAKTEFVSLASHQLRTPLTSINWYTEMLLSGDAGKLKKEQKDYLEEIYEGNQNMLNLVNSLLNVSRVDLGTFMIEPQSTDIVEMCKNVIKEMKPTLTQKKQKVSEKFQKKFPKIDVDTNLMRIVFQNYLSNAAKYTPEKGKITIGITEVKAGKEFKTKTMRMDSFVFYVSDTGYGIPEEQQDKIFSKLFRADNVRAMQAEGTGLGLYIIKSIIESSKGSVWFESKEGKGSTFYAALPMTGMIKKEGQKGLS